MAKGTSKFVWGVIGVFLQTSTPAIAREPYCIASAPNVCYISVQALLAWSPADFRGRRVATTAYLVYRGEEFYLLPSREWAHVAYNSNALLILPEQGNEEHLNSLRKYTDKYVRISGKLIEDQCTLCWGTLALTLPVSSAGIYLPSSEQPQDKYSSQSADSGESDGGL